MHQPVRISRAWWLSPAGASALRRSIAAAARRLGEILHLCLPGFPNRYSTARRHFLFRRIPRSGCIGQVTPPPGTHLLKKAIRDYCGGGDRRTDRSRERVVGDTLSASSYLLGQPVRNLLGEFFCPTRHRPRRKTNLRNYSELALSSLSPALSLGGRAEGSSVSPKQHCSRLVRYHKTELQRTLLPKAFSHWHR